MTDINSKQNISFCAVKASREGLANLARNFSGNKQFCKDLIASQKDIISADIFVSKDDIFIKPHPALDLADMKICGLGQRKLYDRYDGYFVDYLAYDVYKPMKNGYYQIEKASLPDLPKYPGKSILNEFERLFDGACHIAKDLEKRFSKKVATAIEAENDSKNFASKLDIDIVD
ncbi:hypothetical protein DBY21_08675 [Candidatus Gastranaerophilales bacterium]|nr:MAG: hypothetical protein DBY21_08675 [Candidatus Gastranaerophilales bacterium]